MNIYHVRGTIAGFDFEARTPESLTVDADREAETPEDAAQMALTEFDPWYMANTHWEKPPRVEFVREVSQAEMLRRDGYAPLFEI